MSVAVFDLSAFLLRYPEFQSSAAATIAACFVEAGVYLDNTNASPVSDVVLRGVLLNMLTAHIVQLTINPLVGRVSSASEGSVSASADYGGTIGGTQAWYIQTAYGAAYWAATARFRGFRFRARPGCY
jgi:hypothetical protein